jgi:hypothetical protein
MNSYINRAPIPVNGLSFKQTRLREKATYDDAIYEPRKSLYVPRYKTHRRSLPESRVDVYDHLSPHAIMYDEDKQIYPKRYMTVTPISSYGLDQFRRDFFTNTLEAQWHAHPKFAKVAKYHVPRSSMRLLETSA